MGQENSPVVPAFAWLSVLWDSPRSIPISHVQAYVRKLLARQWEGHRHKTKHMEQTHKGICICL